MFWVNIIEIQCMHTPFICALFFLPFYVINFRMLHMHSVCVWFQRTSYYTLVWAFTFHFYFHSRSLSGSTYALSFSCFSSAIRFNLIAYKLLDQHPCSIGIETIANFEQCRTIDLYLNLNSNPNNVDVLQSSAVFVSNHEHFCCFFRSIVTFQKKKRYVYAFFDPPPSLSLIHSFSFSTVVLMTNQKI